MTTRALHPMHASARWQAGGLCAVPNTDTSTATHRFRGPTQQTRGLNPHVTRLSQHSGTLRVRELHWNVLFMFVYPIWGSRGVRRCCRSAAAACVQMNAVSMAHANAVLQSTFRIPHLRYMQPDMVSGRLRGLDVLALMPTGGRKSLCFQLPALCHEGTTIVVLPPLWLGYHLCAID